MFVKINAGTRSILEGILSRGKIYAGGGVELRAEGCNARSRYRQGGGSTTATVGFQSVFQMGLTILHHAPDITVALTAPKERQDCEPQHHIAEGESSHIPSQELIYCLLLH